MPAVAVNEDILDWLTDAVQQNKSYAQMAAHLGCCTDTLKRILHRHGIVEFEGAKYQSRTIDPGPQWNRPCMRCKDTTPRPKWQFFCDPCSAENERIDAEEDDPVILQVAL